MIIADIVAAGIFNKVNKLNPSSSLQSPPCIDFPFGIKNGVINAVSKRHAPITVNGNTKPPIYLK